MEKNDISIATITWARNEGEEKILRESLEQLAQLQIPVFITDGGSGALFLNFLRSIPHFTLLPAKARGVWEQAKNSILASHQSDSKFIFYTEPDKLQFFRDHLINFLNEAQADEEFGILTASRSEAGFATFPPFQRISETAINQCCEEIIGKAIDFTYGPFLMNGKLAPYLKSVQEDIGWGWRPYIFSIAHRLGFRVEAMVGDFTCPPDQRKDNPAERIYRMRQLSQNIQGLVLSTTILLNKE